MSDHDERLGVLFVCAANICRSPFAAELSMGLSDRVACASAGTHGWDAAPMDHMMARELAVRARDATGFRSRALTPGMLRSADLVFTMEVAQRTWILADSPELVEKVFTLAQFARAVAGADPALKGNELLATVRRKRGHADSADDVADPYGRGAAAAAAAAAHIESLLTPVLRRL